MSPCLGRKWLRSPLVAVVLVLGAALAPGGEPCHGPRRLEDLEKLDLCQLEELFRRADLGNPLVGKARGRLLVLTDERMPRLKARAANSVWRGKAADEDGTFVNRWVGGVNKIGSHYVCGPSWVDGRPAVIMEYAPGTPLFANMHDELREIAPGLYLGPVYERFPCPKLRGYLALEQEPCGGRKRLGR